MTSTCKTKNSAIKMFSAFTRALTLVTVCLSGSVILTGLLYAQSVPDSTATNATTATEPSSETADVVAPSTLERMGDWLFNSTQQRRQQLAKESRFDELAEQSGDDQWRAAGQYRRGEFEAAAESYSTYESPRGPKMKMRCITKKLSNS